MKKLAVLSVLILGAFAARPTDAQVRVHVNLNLGAQPEWVPADYGYTQYYYMPDLDAYYWVPRHEYIYLNAGRWVFAASLPDRYRDYDLDRCYKVAIDGDRPWMRDDYYRNRYRGYGDEDRRVAYYGEYGRMDRGDEDHWGRDDHEDRGWHRGWDRGRGNDGWDHGDRGEGHGRGHGWGHRGDD